MYSNLSILADSDLLPFSKLLQMNDFSDFDIKVGEEIFKVHRSVLSVRSEYFDKKFKENVWNNYKILKFST